MMMMSVIGIIIIIISITIISSSSSSGGSSSSSLGCTTAYVGLAWFAQLTGTGVCEKNTILENKTPGNLSLRNTKSGEEFMPMVCAEQRPRPKEVCVFRHQYQRMQIHATPSPSLHRHARASACVEYWCTLLVRACLRDASRLGVHVRV